eukprot:174003_1
MLTILTLVSLCISSVLGLSSEDKGKSQSEDIIAEYQIDLSNLKKEPYSSLNLAIDQNIDALCGALEVWDPMDSSTYAAIANIGPKLLPFRTLLALPDGAVIYDQTQGVKNTYENARDKAIAENHNSRPAVLSALLNDPGMAWEKRLSTTDQTITNYVARRCGEQFEGSGTIRLSVTK